MKNKNLTEIVFNDIRDKILGFQLLSGNKISDKEIAESMEISRSPVRQALFRLAENGLVESRHNRGFVVKQFSVQEIKDLHILRKTLELGAIDLVIENLTDETARKLTHTVEALKSPIETADIPGITAIDWEFHNLIIEGGQNTLMIDFYRTLQDRIKIAFPHLQTQGPIMWEIYNEHKEILDNILYKNPDGARYALAGHIMGALEINLEAIKNDTSTAL